MNAFLIIAFAVLFVAPPGVLPAQVPQLISYQGRVGVDGVNFDGSGQFKFAFVNAAGSTTYWSNDGSSTAGSEPGTAINIPVSKGLYAVLLGDATLAHMSIVPATVFTNGDVHLRVWFSDGVNGFQQLTPDRRIAAVGYAMMADSVSDGAITTAKIADGAVTSAKLAAGVVQTANLATGAVGNAQLANSAVTINAGTGLGGGGLVSLGGNVTLSNAGVLTLTGGGGISVDAGTGAITLGSNATSASTAGAIVARDANGGFTAGTITGTLNGNAATATTATDFTGMLAGDVTGTQAATVMSTVGGLSAANIAAGATLANTATSANTASTLVTRDASGGFAAGNMTVSSISIPATTSATVGVLNQNGSRFMHSFGTSSFFAGPGAGNFTTTGTGNTAAGLNALSAISTGNHNVAYGSSALLINSAGHNNVAIGHDALLNNTTGNSNIAIGLSAGNALTTGSDNIAIGNAGVAGETGIIRIGTAGLHTNTHLAGVIHGNGSGLDGVVTKVDRQFVTVGSSTSNSSYQVIASLTTRDIGSPGCYLVNFNCQGSVANGGYQGILVLSINGVDVASTQRSFQNTAIGGGGDSRSFTYLLTSAPEGTVLAIKLRSTSNGQGVSVSFGSFSIDGIPQANVQ